MYLTFDLDPQLTLNPTWLVSIYDSYLFSDLGRPSMHLFQGCQVLTAKSITNIGISDVYEINTEKQHISAIILIQILNSFRGDIKIPPSNHNFFTKVHTTI